MNNRLAPGSPVSLPRTDAMRHPLRLQHLHRYPPGTPRLRRSMVEVRAGSLWREWYGSGVPRCVGMGLEGRSEGVRTHLRPTGQVRERGHVQADRCDAPVEDSCARRTKRFEGSNRSDERVGMRWLRHPGGPVDRMERHVPGPR